MRSPWNAPQGPASARLSWRSVSDAAALGLLAILLGLGLGDGAQAHEARPGYLELKQTAAETWDVLEGAGARRSTAWHRAGVA
jgi:hypothetical protein